VGRGFAERWQASRRGGGDLQGRAIGPQEGQRAVASTDDAESAFVHRAVMTSAQQHEVVEARGAAVGPVCDVVGVASPRGTAWKAAARVARRQGAANRWRERARLAAHAEHGAVGVGIVAHGHQRRVAREALRRFRRNVHRAVIHFESAVESVGCRGAHGHGCGRGLVNAGLGRAAPGLARGHVQHHLVAVARGAAIHVGGQGRLGQHPKSIGATLGRRQFLGDRVAGWCVRGFAKQPVRRGLERALHDGADLGGEPSTNHDHAIVVHPRGELALQVPRLCLLRRLHAVHTPPRPHHAFDVGAVAGERQVEERRFVVGGGHAGQRAHLGVRDLPALHRRTDARQDRERPGHAHLLARGAEVDAGTPVEPVRARDAAVVPARALVELVEQHE
jgi:hypothetical protein